ncbi:hypothetical protein DYU11_13770 [Fibrisoma montanum]|uniref:TonB C-terminal domain-containing protein n=1 Tax=Fibrisoma montanum TaxID=2305895 RepID=A0A418MCD4_9BACT|nr:hypothetical protein [Fibrisoma montanum]RIV24027.1 hypothetical protein DYU11_13770 [Fibrisoma montanum]
MKTLLLPAFLLLFTTAQARPVHPQTSRHGQSLATQLTAGVQCPTALIESGRSGVIVVSFRIGADQRLTDLVVHTDNERINAELTRQLLGRKLTGQSGSRQQTHIVRFHFQLS